MRKRMQLYIHLNVRGTEYIGDDDRVRYNISPTEDKK